MPNHDTLRTHEQRPIARILAPIDEFAHKQTTGGILLLLCAVAAMVWANSPWGEIYQHLWHVPVLVSMGGKSLGEPLHFWINDGLMVIFFFVIGLEIKREILVGELRSVKQAMLPIAAAFGGMVVPAAIYYKLNAGGPGQAGWGIPMATDIAFAIGMLALLGRGVPAAITVFLTALAIVDDLGAVLVIALFYTDNISIPALVAAGSVLLLMMIANLLWVRSPLVYALLSVMLWLAFLQSGVHATIAGVLAAFCIPARGLVDPSEFVRAGRDILNRFLKFSEGETFIQGKHLGRTVPLGIFRKQEQISAIAELERACEQVLTPLQRLEYSLHGWVTLAIMPVFALANAGVVLGANALQSMLEPVTLGVLFGLVIGKPIGIVLFSWLAVQLRAASLPEGVRWSQIVAVGFLGGIGFTMSLFIAGLAFHDESVVDQAKTGILAASLLAAVFGGVLLRIAQRQPVSEQA